MSKAADEIARDLGVSVTTVRLVMNGKADRYRISEATQARVTSYIEQHGYVLNQTARSLSLRRTETLGLIVPYLTNPFFSMLAEQFEEHVRGFDYQLISACSHDEEGLEKKLTANLLARGVDGLFVTPSTRRRQAALVRESKDKPVVFIDRDFGVPEAITVTSDNFRGSLEMVEEIFRHVEEPLFYLGGDTRLPTVQSRLRGFEAAHERHGRALHPQWLYQANRNRAEYGFTLMQRLHRAHGCIPAGFVCSSLPILEGALHFIRERFGAIPSELLIGTFDDHTMLEFLPNRVFSVRQNPDAIASLAFERMRQMLTRTDDEAPHSAVVNPTLVLRRSLER